MKNNINKHLRGLTVPFCLLLIYLLLYMASTYAILETPFSFIKYRLPLNDFAGKFTYEELKDENELHIDSLRDYSKESYYLYNISTEDKELLDDILSGYVFKTAFVDCSASGSVRHPNNQIVLYCTNYKDHFTLFQHHNGIISYGIISITLMEDRVIINRGVVHEKSIFETPSDDSGFYSTDMSSIPYYCKDLELVNILQEFVNKVMNK